MPEFTRLEAFLKSRGIKPAHLARQSGYSRQHLLRIRMGRMEPTRPCIAAIVNALRRMSGESIRAGDLFDLGEEVKPGPCRLDTATSVFYGILGRFGVPLEFLAASLRPALPRATGKALATNLSRARIKELIDHAARQEHLDGTAQHSLYQMFDRLRERICEMNTTPLDAA